MNKLGNPTPTHVLVHRLRLMADAGGVLTRDRIKTIIEAADRIDTLDEKVELLSPPDTPDPLNVDPFQEDWR